MCVVKRCSNIYFIWVKKKDLFGLFQIQKEIRDKDNETGLNKGGGIEMSNYSAFHIRDCTRSLFAFKYLPLYVHVTFQSLDVYENFCLLYDCVQIAVYYYYFYCCCCSCCLKGRRRKRNPWNFLLLVLLFSNVLKNFSFFVRAMQIVYVQIFHDNFSFSFQCHRLVQVFFSILMNIFVQNFVLIFQDAHPCRSAIAPFHRRSHHVLAVVHLNKNLDVYYYCK